MNVPAPRVAQIGHPWPRWWRTWRVSPLSRSGSLTRYIPCSMPARRPWRNQPAEGRGPTRKQGDMWDKMEREGGTFLSQVITYQNNLEKYFSCSQQFVLNLCNNKTRQNKYLWMFTNDQSVYAGGILIPKLVTAQKTLKLFSYIWSGRLQLTYKRCIVFPSIHVHASQTHCAKQWTPVTDTRCEPERWFCLIVSESKTTQPSVRLGCAVYSMKGTFSISFHFINGLKHTNNTMSGLE